MVGGGKGRWSKDLARRGNVFHVVHGKQELVDRLRNALKDAPNEVVAVYLYGSQARGTGRPHSDIDLALWRRTRSDPRLVDQSYGLAVALEAVLGREVDLVELNRAPVDLIHEVLRDGVIVLDRDPAARVRNEVQARAAYLDMLPVLRRYRRHGDRAPGER